MTDKPLKSPKKLETLGFNLKVMKILTLWPENKKISKKFLMKHALLVLSIGPGIVTLIFGMIYIKDDIIGLLDDVVATTAIIAMEYMCQCFLNRLKDIEYIVKEIQNFAKYGAEEVIQNTEVKIQKYTKGILIYCIVGNLCYGLFKLENIQKCTETRKSELSKQRDPCGMIVRTWSPFDVSIFPRFHIMFVMQLYICVVTSIIVLSTTMLLVGLLMYIVTLLKHCREAIRNCIKPGMTDEDIKIRFRFCTEYHIAILVYASSVTKAFSSMMLVHMTLTSFEISVLGFEVLMVTSIMDSLRFGMHLVGWLILLFLICFYGQKIIDESTGLGWEAYSTEWYNAPVCVQKDLKMMIMRSQKPLVLSAASLGVMSLETYLGVLSSAYSYFTLLLNMKNKSTDK